ncbi:MAG: tRNA dihydrouridine synthase DusB [Pseudomonadota bacterium]
MNPLSIGHHTLGGRALLAPMSGISDWPFRRLASRFGAPLVVSEMVASDRLVAREAETRLKLEGAGIPIHAVQLAGCRAEDMAEAARIAEAAGAHIIDINMGCPAKRLVGGWAGSALMRDVDHAASLIRATIAAVRLPVTVKMRLGFDQTRKNAAELAVRAAAEGAALVTVHGRTRCQRYKGRADWSAIRAVKEAVPIPVVANGDCGSACDARAMLAASGADGVMVGRAALGAPWLPGAISAALKGSVAMVPSTPAAIGAIAAEHLEMLVAANGPQGLKYARKHTAAYAEHFRTPPGLKKRALTAETERDAVEAIKVLFEAAEPSHRDPMEDGSSVERAAA